MDFSKPAYLGQWFHDAGPGWLTPEEPQENRVLIDSPFEHQHSIAVNDVPGLAMESREKPVSVSTADKRNTKSGKNDSSLRFFVVAHPDELKDKTQMRKNRVHVMHNYLDKEARKPHSKDARVHSQTLRGTRRKSGREGPVVLEKDTDVSVSQSVFRPGVCRISPADSVQSSFDSGYSDQESTYDPARKIARVTGSKQDTSATYPECLQNTFIETRPLVTGLGGRFENSQYLRVSAHEIPFGGNASLSEHNIGGRLEPFGVWPTFHDSSMEVSELKWSCSQRFGSESLSTHWVPTLLRARHAFLSTICISSTHDDIMRRSLLPASRKHRESLLKRLRIRQGVTGMINESINDPEMRTADETIIAVLHVLNSEIMVCNDRAMRIHQMGLHEMVKERGGLDHLGVAGQLAAVLTITMFLLGALRETPPHRDFVTFAAKQCTRIPNDGSNLPESPLYYRPQGFYTIKKTLSTRSDTYGILDTLRALTNRFYIENRGHSTGTSSSRRTTTTRSWEQSNETVSSLCDKVFAFSPAWEKDFDGMNERYTYEAIRLTALIYAHALQRKVSFSRAAVEVRDRKNLSLPDATTSMPVLVNKALMRTDTSYCWGHMAGVLFWVVLIAGAAANPGALAKDDRVGGDEDARKWISAIAVRCCIVLSFEYGSSVLETLKRLVAIETALGQSDDEVDAETSACQRIIGPLRPPPIQRGFADFAQEFMSI